MTPHNRHSAGRVAGAVAAMFGVLIGSVTVQAVLPPDFERIHKSYLVRLGSIKALHAAEGSHYEAELKGGERLPVGRTRYKELRDQLI